MTALADLRPRTPDPRRAPALRWGVIGTGWIAARFVDAVSTHTGQRFTAVASRDRARGEDFARAHGITRTHTDVRALAADPEVDVVYVASPHTSHHEHAITTIAAGTPVLVEKPIGINAAQAEEIAHAARTAGVFCAEALWTYFLPRWDVVEQALASGVVGSLRSVLADYGEYLPDEHRAMDPALAGGSLLDLGTYPISLVSRLLGEPRTVAAQGADNRHGVNAHTAAIVSDTAGATGVVFTSLESSTPTTAVIAGDRGAIELDGPFYQPGGVRVRTWSDGEVYRYDEPRTGHTGLHFEAAAVARAIAAGHTEAEERPLDESVTFLRLMDRIRAEAGIRFIGD
ncbi:Gfo/Idh/MocA family protein [Promicromonospora sp. Populi]|uniref:Gfo/Idh/MocA family protein n=1 Tax=Promicromonospora sp. Populi TaxID=3239420 RepID=UPI0034E2F764